MKVHPSEIRLAGGPIKRVAAGGKSRVNIVQNQARYQAGLDSSLQNLSKKQTRKGPNTINYAILGGEKYYWHPECLEAPHGYRRFRKPISGVGSNRKVCRVSGVAGFPVLFDKPQPEVV